MAAMHRRRRMGLFEVAWASSFLRRLLCWNWRKRWPCGCLAGRVLQGSLLVLQPKKLPMGSMGVASPPLLPVLFARYLKKMVFVALVWVLLGGSVAGDLILIVLKVLCWKELIFIWYWLWNFSVTAWRALRNNVGESLVFFFKCSEETSAYFFVGKIIVVKGRWNEVACNCSDQVWLCLIMET